MKYVVTRILALALAMFAINYISNYVGEKAQPEYAYMESAIAFVRLSLAVVIVSLGIFTFEAYRFNKQGKIKMRNLSLMLIALVMVIMIGFGGFFTEFV